MIEVQDVSEAGNGRGGPGHHGELAAGEQRACDRCRRRCGLGGRNRETVAEAVAPLVPVPLAGSRDAEIGQSGGGRDPMRRRRMSDQPLRQERQGEQQGDDEAHLAHG